MKSRDTLTPIGPWIVAKEAIPDPHNLALRTRVNGELRQQGTTADLIFSIPFLIAYFLSGIYDPATGRQDRHRHAERAIRCGAGR